MRARLTFALVLASSLSPGCTPSSGDLDPLLPWPPDAPLQVYGRDMGAAWANVSVLSGGREVDDARVEVNGERLGPCGDEPGCYTGSLTAPVPAGGELVLVVARGKAIVTGVGTVPDAPVLGAPADGTVVPRGADLAVSWTSPTDPDYFSVVASWPCGASCRTGAELEVPGAARAVTIPAGWNPDVVRFDLAVFAYEDGTFQGDYAPVDGYPGMNIRAESAWVSVARER